MLAAVLSIGTELTRGEIANTNCTWLCQRLTSLGVQVGVCETVSDDISNIGAAVQRLGETHELVVSTGGLGPTTDDLTAASVAKQLGVSLLTDEPSLERITARLTRSGRELTASNRKQADLPEGSEVLNNDWGTAPGFALTTHKARSFFLPGVPLEMRPMFEAYVAPHVRAKAKRGTHQIRLRTFGAPESQVNDTLVGIEEQFNVVLAYRAKFPLIEVKTLAFRDTDVQARIAAEQAANEVRQRLGSLVFAEGEQELAEVVAGALRKRDYSLGLAESCTGGLVAELFTKHPASDYFKGAIVCYDNEVKSRLLKVSTRLLEAEGAVSEAVVRQMATGARETLGADVGLSLSGIAGPTGGSEEKPVGLVHYAVATPSEVVARHKIFIGDRRRVQVLAAYAGLNLIREVLARQTKQT